MILSPVRRMRRRKRKKLRLLRKENTDDAAKNGEKKYFEFELNSSDRTKLKEAENNGLHIYGMTVYIQKECLLKAARAFLVFKAVEEFGEIIVYNPTSQEIEDEHFDNDFSFFITQKNLTTRFTGSQSVI